MPPTITTTSYPLCVESQPKRPPRPPNEWIIYRSEKVRTLPRTRPDGTPVSQKDLSKIISTMWRSEPLAEKERYAQLSEMKVTEHKKRYPEYKYQPLSKAEKLRLKEYTKAEKARARQGHKEKGNRQTDSSNFRPLSRFTSAIIDADDHLSPNPSPSVASTSYPTTPLEQPLYPRHPPDGEWLQLYRSQAGGSSSFNSLWGYSSFPHAGHSVEEGKGSVPSIANTAQVHHYPNSEATEATEEIFQQLEMLMEQRRPQGLRQNDELKAFFTQLGIDVEGVLDEELFKLPDTV